MTRTILEGDADKIHQKLTLKVHDQIAAGKQKTFEIQLLRCIEEKLTLLSQNPFSGIQIQKRQIPKFYNVKNL